MLFTYLAMEVTSLRHTFLRILRDDLIN